MQQIFINNLDVRTYGGNGGMRMNRCNWNQEENVDTYITRSHLKGLNGELLKCEMYIPRATLSDSSLKKPEFGN